MMTHASLSFGFLCAVLQFAVLAQTRSNCYESRPGDGPASMGVPNLVADRYHQNRMRLPWTDTLPPVTIRDDAVCRRAARSYLRDSLAVVPDSMLLATVVRAGGLYFVRARPVERAGEFGVTAVLDSAFRVVTRLANP
jgi:hypothetical protein